MTRLSAIPQTATMVGHKSGRLNCGASIGKAVDLRLMSAYCSAGYKSGYERVLTLFLVCAIEGQRTYVKRHSGRRIEEAKSEFASVCKMIDGEGGAA